MKNRAEFSDLALGLLQQNLSKAEKELAFRLIAEEPEFLKVLQTELVLKRRIEALKVPIPSDLKRDVYLQIKEKGQGELHQELMQMVFDLVLPGVFKPFQKLFQRSVLASG